MTKTELAEMADKMIGAAQELERAAKRLKAEAGYLRRGSSLSPDMDPRLWTMHKVSDVRRGAELALAELDPAVRLHLEG